MAETYTRPATHGDIIAHCRDWAQSVREVTIKGAVAEQVLPAGQVLAEYTATADDGKYAVPDAAGADGLEVASAVALDAVTVPAGTDTKVLVVDFDATVFAAQLTIPGSAAEQAVFVNQLRRNQRVLAA